jgi:hypothetical protein
MVVIPFRFVFFSITDCGATVKASARENVKNVSLPFLFCDFADMSKKISHIRAVFGLLRFFVFLITIY